MKLEETSLNDYLLINLAPLTKADPGILAKYVTALLRKEKPMEELKKFCAENLVDFLGNGTELFVSNLFKAIDKGSVLTLPEKLDVNDDEHVGVPLIFPTKDLPQPPKPTKELPQPPKPTKELPQPPQPTKDLPRPPQLRIASMKTGCSSSGHNLEKQGWEDDDKTETHFQSKEASGDDDHKFKHCRKETHSQSEDAREHQDRKLKHCLKDPCSEYKEAREAFARKLKHCKEVALKDDDHKRKRSGRESHPQSKEALKDDDRSRHKRSRRESHSQSKRVRRGHKRKRHRRETHSHSLDRDVAESQYLERPDRVRSEVHKNGKRLLGSDPPSSDNLKSDDSDSSRKPTEINAKPPSSAPSSESPKDDNSKMTEINGEHPSPASSPSNSWDLEMRSRVNPSPYADPDACSDFSTGLGCNPLERRLERTPGHWSQHHSIFSEYVYRDRELQTRQRNPWIPNGRPYAFHPRGWQRTPGHPMNQRMPVEAYYPRDSRMYQGMPMDAFHHFSWQRTLGPPTTGMPYERCRDFEELGFCLKGDACPMDHGIDRIIVKDIQSLSQLNLPVSLSRTNFTETRTPRLVSGCPPSGLLAHGANAADLYEPDQPPRNNARSEPSDALIIEHTSPKKPLRTLYIKNIPPKENKIEPLLSHFQKFGVVEDINITADREKAYIQFSKREAAEAAISSPDALLGNRFIQISWARKDRFPELDESSSSTPPILPQVSLANRQEEDLSFELQEVNDAPAADIHKLASSSQKKVGSSNFSTKETQLKQELIDQNQSDFKPEDVISFENEENTEKAAEKHELGRVPMAATKIPTNLVNSGAEQGNMETLGTPKLKDLSDSKFLAETVILPGLSMPPSSIIRLACNVASQATTSTDTVNLVAQRNIDEHCQNLNIVQ